jgi:hypothetical protein
MTPLFRSAPEVLANVIRPNVTAGPLARGALGPFSALA